MKITPLRRNSLHTLTDNALGGMYCSTGMAAAVQTALRAPSGSAEVAARVAAADLNGMAAGPVDTNGAAQHRESGAAAADTAPATAAAAQAAGAAAAPSATAPVQVQALRS